VNYLKIPGIILIKKETMICHVSHTINSEVQWFISSPAVQSQRCAKLASWHLRTEAVFDPARETRLALPD